MSATAVRLGDQATVTVTIGGQSTGVQPLQVHRECSLNFFAAFEDGCGTDFRQMSLDDFPLEVLSRILARLPDHRTVLRCCAVSKQWNALIRSEAFGQDHLLPCRRARHMWQGDGMHVMSNFKNLSDEDVGWLHVLRKGMVANGAEAWTCGHITTPADLVDGAHPGPCAAKGQWFDLLRELAFMEYLVRLVGGETRDNVYPPWNYSVRPVLFGTNLAALGDGVEVNEEVKRPAC
ncbi:hypothetical protein DFJ77DRAFT_134369 [Powellomyces hirtus]|nr:hypothetical protein DFJ77DRAFT_134369 [Powellomyces hirtus]